MDFLQSDLIDAAIKHKKNMIALCKQEGITITTDVEKALNLSSESYAYQYLLRKKFQELFEDHTQNLRNLIKGLKK